MIETAEPLVIAEDLCKYFQTRSGILRTNRGEVVKAVDGVDLSVPKGMTTALVGESGSGKTTFGKTILRIYKPTRGKILFEGTDMSNVEGSKLKKLRSRMAMVFQDPASSLNPRRHIKDIISDPYYIHKLYEKSERTRRVKELLDLVQLPENYMYKIPGALSGGEKQRVGIARALALNPDLIVLDEPTASLDVSVQAKILLLLKNLQTRFHLTYLLITHDLSVVKYFSNRVGVMYLGKVQELAPADELFKNPLHPYTISLLSSIPTIFDDERLILPKKVTLQGEIPSPFNIPSGCRFNTRCPEKIGEICELKEPELILARAKDHFVRCHKFG